MEVAQVQDAPAAEDQVVVHAVAAEQVVYALIRTLILMVEVAAAAVEVVAPAVVAALVPLAEEAVASAVVVHAAQIGRAVLILVVRATHAAALPSSAVRIPSYNAPMLVAAAADLSNKNVVQLLIYNKINYNNYKSS